MKTLQCTLRFWIKTAGFLVFYGQSGENLSEQFGCEGSTFICLNGFWQCGEEIYQGFYDCFGFNCVQRYSLGLLSCCTHQSQKVLMTRLGFGKWTYTV